MLGFLTAKTLGLPRLAWIVLIAAAIGAGVAIANHAFDGALDAAADKGAAEARNAGLDATLGQIGAAKDGADEIRNDAGYARYCECLLDATEDTAGNCDKHLPDEPLPERRPDPDTACPR